MRRLFWCLLSLSILAAPAAAAKKPPPEVPLHVHFLDSEGYPVTDLQPDEVKVLQGTRELEVRRVLGPDEPFDIGLVLDVSPSVETYVDAIRDETSRLFHSTRPRDQGMILTFDSRIYVDCDWTDDRREIDEAIFELGLHKGGDSSVIYDALAVSLEAKFWERGPRQLLIFFSDGVETGSEDTKEEESLEVARRSGVLTYVIQYDPRPHYLRLHRGAMYDPTWEPPPGTTGTSVGGIFVGSGRPSRTDRAGYMVGRMFDRAVQYLRKVAESGRGEYHMMLEPSDLASIYRRILTDLEHLSTVTIDPTPGQGIQGVTIETTRPGVTAQLVTKGFWPH